MLELQSEPKDGVDYDVETSNTGHLHESQK